MIVNLDGEAIQRNHIYADEDGYIWYDRKIPLNSMNYRPNSKVLGLCGKWGDDEEHYPEGDLTLITIPIVWLDTWSYDGVEFLKKCNFRTVSYDEFMEIE